MRQFNFRKTIRRNDFTNVFGGAGKRRVIPDFAPERIEVSRTKKISKIARTRRANLGKNNKRFGKIHRFKMFVKYGKCIRKLKPISRFRR